MPGSPEPGALPLLLTHGWPGSTVEFMKAIPLLTDPVAHGGDAADAFHVVAPRCQASGSATSQPAPAGAWTASPPPGMQLMVRLGYDRYVAQGGDWGSSITTRIGAQNLGHCAGIHVNMPVAFPTAEEMSDLNDVEVAALAKFQRYQDHDSGYSKRQSTRPQTIGYALADSPAGQAAWILEKFWAWTDNDGYPEDALTRDELLDNVMMYWLTGAAASSARIYWESFRHFGGVVVPIPAGVTVFHARSSARPGGGPSAPTPTSATGTRSIAAAASRPSRNPICSSTSCAPASARCADREAGGGTGQLSSAVRVIRGSHGFLLPLGWVEAAPSWSSSWR